MDELDENDPKPRYSSALGTRPAPRAPMGALGWMGIALLVVLAGSGAGWWYYHRTPAALAPPPAVPTAAVEPRGLGTPTPTATDMASGDAQLREAAPQLSHSKDLLDWLSQGDILRRLVAAVNTLAEGKNPRPLLGFLAPAGNFEVASKDRALYAAETQGARYDRVVGVLTSIDVSAAAKTYTKLKPFIQSAYAEVAPPGASFDTTLHETLRLLIATPLPTAPPKLEPKGALYAYADPKLEALPASQKSLLRLGDKNARALQAWLKALDESLVPAPP